MERVGPGEILSATFQFIRDHLKAIAIWSAVYLAAMIAMPFALAPFAAEMASGQPNGNIWLVLLIIYAVFIGVFVVLTSAIFRAALDPQQRDSSYLRLGMDEFRLFGLLLLLIVIYFVGMMVLVLGFGIVAVGMAAIGGLPMAIVANIAFFIAIIASLIFFAVRLGSAGPLIILRKKTITLGDSWRLTRGHFWSLFGAYAVIAVIWIIFAIVFFMVLFAGMGSTILEQMRHPGGDPVAQRALIAAQLQQMSGFGPVQIVLMIVSTVVYMVLFALQCGSVAIATKLLLHEETPSEVF